MKKHMLDHLADKADDGQDMHAKAKLDVLGELRQMAMDMMGDKVRGKLPHEMHGVEVMAPDKQGLQKGLDLAKEVASTSGLPHHGSNGSPMDDAAGDVEDQHAMDRNEPSGDEGEPDQHMLNPAGNDDDDDMSHDEIDSMIAELQAKKQAKSSKY